MALGSPATAGALRSAPVAAPEAASEGGEATAARASRGRRLAAGIWPCELLGYGGMLATLAFLRLGGVLNLGWESIGFTFATVLRVLPLYFAVGIAARLLERLLTRRSPVGYLRAIASWRWLLGWLRTWSAGAAMIYAYMWLKVAVPLANPALHDARLWQLDQWLHFGVAPTVFAVELMAGSPLPELLDLWYSGFVTTVLLAFSWAAAADQDAPRRNFLLAQAALWIAGAWIYVALPALGPCYAFAEIREPVRAEMPRAIGAQSYLMAQYGRMVSSRGRLLESFNPSLGVAALPSLHVGAHWLLALWARRHARRLFLPLAAATLLTFVGSLVSTWHYAVDGYLGALLAWGAVRLADRWEPVESASPPEPT